MYRCNKVTKKHVILFVSIPTQTLKDIGVLVYTYKCEKCPRSLAMLAR